jgi:tripartite-type tricarboxylate transporter receptor subunit TctC
MTPEQFTAQVKSEYDRLREVVRLSGARVE